MKIKCLTLSDLEQVRQWRNEQREMLRTPFLLTAEQQEKFYETVICNRQANARFWGIMERYELISMIGLENIQWENRLAEISLLLNPQHPMEKHGEETLRLLLHEGFMNMNLENIFTEVYHCNPSFDFWFGIAKKYNSMVTFLPYRKYYNGEYYHSTYINFSKGAFMTHEPSLEGPVNSVN